MGKLTKEMLITVPGTPYWCGAQDKLKKKKPDPHWMASLCAGSNKRTPKSKMMDVEIEAYMLGYNETGDK